MAGWVEDITFYTPGTGDARRTYELIVRCDIADYGEPDNDLEDLQFDWGQIDLERDAWLATAPSGELIGYAAVVPWGPCVRYDVYLDPGWEGQDLGSTLLARCEARGAEIAQARDQALVAKCYVAHANRRLAEIVTQAGLCFVAHHYQMEIRLDEPPPAPRWPEGVSLRTAVPDQDDPAIHQLVETAFARPDRTPTTLDEWQGLMKRADLYDPDLWFLALSKNEIVGICLSYAYPDTGWVRQLAVTETWRRKGIGAALLRHAFALFQERGYDRAGLAVDAENENALLFYQRLGLRPVRRHDEYSKSVGKEPR
jgi:mycothiol synthase